MNGGETIDKIQEKRESELEIDRPLARRSALGRTTADGYCGLTVVGRGRVHIPPAFFSFARCGFVVNNMVLACHVETGSATIPIVI